MLLLEPIDERQRICLLQHLRLARREMGEFGGGWQPDLCIDLCSCRTRVGI